VRARIGGAGTAGAEAEGERRRAAAGHGRPLAEGALRPAERAVLIQYRNSSQDSVDIASGSMSGAIARLKWPVPWRRLRAVSRSMSGGTRLSIGPADQFDQFWDDGRRAGDGNGGIECVVFAVTVNYASASFPSDDDTC
jgi:hypothetical protein